MLENEGLGKADCKTPVGDIIALGSRLSINSTPTIIAHDGRRLSGAIPADRLRAWATKTK